MKVPYKQALRVTIVNACMTSRALQLRKLCLGSAEMSSLFVLDHRNTLTEVLSSTPLQRFMSKRTGTVIPTTTKLLELRVVKQSDSQQKAWNNQRNLYYNKGTKRLPPSREAKNIFFYFAECRILEKQLMPPQRLI